ncbi:hypothetical protein MY10362_008768 [Beauveria mimosiformis]
MAFSEPLQLQEARTYLFAIHFSESKLEIAPDADIRLNDHDPADPVFATLWAEAGLVQSAGVKVMGMVGGAAPGSFTPDTLDGEDAVFEKYYQQLYSIVKESRLDGLDLDVEENMSLDGIIRLIRRLRNDFGSNFIITLAPVASALVNGANLSGFSYSYLEAHVGTEIAFYNVQLYSGFGTMATPDDYIRSISAGWIPRKIVAGQLTSPNTGYGYIPLPALNRTINALRVKYGEIGGIMGWEYYGGDPGGEKTTLQWTRIVSAALWQPGRANAKRYY